MLAGENMKTKEKEEKTQKGKKISWLRNSITFLAFIISLLCGVIFYNYSFKKNNVYASEMIQNEIQEIKISGAQEINIEEIISQNKQEGRREEYLVEEMTLEYVTKYRNNASLPKGQMQVVQEGREGKQEIIIKRTYQQEALVAEETVGSKVKKAAVNKIVEVGTANFTSNYKVKVGDTLYVTSDRLSVMVEPVENSQKVATLEKGNALKLLEIQNQWYKISSSGMIGYVKAESTTYIDSNKKQEIASEKTTKKKAQLMADLHFDMPLNKPSGFTLEQFKKVLSDGKDTNKIFEKNAEYFYYIEQQYQINGIFVATMGIHESNWGTSKIARDKKNLFGYGAYDSNPYQGAYHFSDYAESIDLLARVLVKYYLNPKGTSIYGGEKAIGNYYNGSTLKGVNTKYATDKNWASCVFSHMKYLYNKL